jgi:hypothetical protein
MKITWRNDIEHLVFMSENGKCLICGKLLDNPFSTIEFFGNENEEVLYLTTPFCSSQCYKQADADLSLEIEVEFRDRRRIRKNLNKAYHKARREEFGEGNLFTDLVYPSFSFPLLRWYIFFAAFIVFYLYFSNFHWGVLTFLSVFTIYFLIKRIYASYLLGILFDYINEFAEDGHDILNGIPNYSKNDEREL